MTQASPRLFSLLAAIAVTAVMFQQLFLAAARASGL